MTLKKLSEQVSELANAQRSDTFVRNFREEVRRGKFEATYVPGERFTLPKTYTRRGSTDVYQRDTKEMLFRYTPEFQRWFDEQNRQLAVSRRGGKIKPTIENMQAGLVSFEEMARATRKKMQESFEKGQALGKSRGRKGGSALHPIR